MLTIFNLSKKYSNGVSALNNVALSIRPGIFGLLGPNGAGKSSLMRTIATLQDPDSGHIEFDGLNVLKQKEKLRAMLGYLPQDFGLYPSSSAEDLLDHLALLKGIASRTERKETVTRLLELCNLAQHRKKKLGGFSGGMRQRFGIAQALLGSPKLIIVDEPTAGLDPEERDRFHNLLSHISEEVTVILSTHIVSDVSELCQDMAIINQGKVLIQESPVVAMEKLEGKIWTKVIDKKEVEDATANYKVVAARLAHGRVLLRVYAEESPGSEFQASSVDLEDVYFAYIRSYISADGA
jgi:ABC-2 type transport system ATP-binding protein